MTGGFNGFLELCFLCSEVNLTKKVGCLGCPLSKKHWFFAIFFGRFFALAIAAFVL